MVFPAKGPGMKEATSNHCHSILSPRLGLRLPSPWGVGKHKAARSCEFFWQIPARPAYNHSRSVQSGLKRLFTRLFYSQRPNFATTSKVCITNCENLRGARRFLPQKRLGRPRKNEKRWSAPRGLDRLKSVTQGRAVLRALVWLSAESLFLPMFRSRPRVHPVVMATDSVNLSNQLAGAVEKAAGGIV